MRLADYARDVDTGDPFLTGNAIIYGPDGVQIASVAVNGTTGRWFYQANGSPGVTMMEYSGGGQVRRIQGDAYGQAGNAFESELPEMMQAFGDGVYGNNPMPLSAPGGLFVRVGTGNMVILGVLLPQYTATDYAVAAGHATLARIDTVVGRLTRTGTYAGRAVIAVVGGTPAASPVAPALVQTADTWEVQLGQIAVPAAASAVTTGMLSTTGRTFAHLHVATHTIRTAQQIIFQGDAIGTTSIDCNADEICTGGAFELSVGPIASGPYVIASRPRSNGWETVTYSLRGIGFNVTTYARCLKTAISQVRP